MMTLVRLSYNDGDTTTKWYKTNGTMDLRLKELWPKAAKYISGLDSDGLKANECKRLSEVLGIKITESLADGRSKTMKALDWCDVWKVYAFAKKKRYIVRPYSAAPNLWELFDTQTNMTIMCHAFAAKLEGMERNANSWDRLLKGKDDFKYPMLGRLENDCRVFLDPESPHYKSPDRLWAKSVAKHIEYMLDLWDSMKVKPEWLTREQIIDLRRRML